MESKVEIMSQDQIVEVILLNRQMDLELMTEADLSPKTLSIYNADSLKGRIELDMYRYAIIYCIDQKYSLKQISALVSILRRVHTCCYSTPFDNYNETMELFQQLLTCHSINQIPFSTALFSAQQCSSLLDYFTLTYFAHFYLYKYVFTCKPSLTLRLLNNPIQDCVGSAPVLVAEQERINTEKKSSITDITVQESKKESQSNQIDNLNDFDLGEHNIMGVVSNIITPKIANIKQNFLEEMMNKEEIIEKKLLSLEKAVHTKK